MVTVGTTRGVNLALECRYLRNPNNSIYSRARVNLEVLHLGSNHRGARHDDYITKRTSVILWFLVLPPRPPVLP